MKRCKAVLAMLLVCAILCLPGCVQNGGSSQPPTQEEVQQEMVEALDYMRIVMKEEKNRYRTIELGVNVDGQEVRVFHEFFKEILRVYELDTQKPAPTLEEVIELFAQYDSEKYAQMKAVAEWFRYYDGENKWWLYQRALSEADVLYNRTHSDSLLDGKAFVEELFENKLLVEDFVRENPDFSEERGYAYKQLLVWLELENPDASSASSSSDGVSVSVAENGSVAA